MPPRFHNPHLLTQSAHTVSRADLERDGDDSPDGPEPLGTQDGSILAALESLVKRSLGEFTLHAEEHNEGSERKKKPRRIQESTPTPIHELESTPFRLLSSSEPKRLSLKPPPPPVIKSLEPQCEDNESEARIRAERAAAVAVDASWVLQESRTPYHTSSRDNIKRYTLLNPASSVTPSPIQILSLPPSSPPLYPTSSRLPEKSRPSPHDIQKVNLACPITDIAPPPQPLAGKRGSKRRRSKGPPREKPRPAFWCPLREYGGKSAGYAYGHANSRPIYSEEARRRRVYRRDRMREGEFVV